MEITDLIKRYFAALESGDVNAILSLFTEDAFVVSPLYGTIPAKKFYKELFEDTNQSKIYLLNIFTSHILANTCAGHFRYDWTMKDGTLVSFECVDVFQLSEDNKFAYLTIIYDTAQTRQAFEHIKS